MGWDARLRRMMSHGMPGGKLLAEYIKICYNSTSL